MSQVIEQDAIKSDEFYKTEVRRMLDEIKLKNEGMDKTQAEIVKLQDKSVENLKRIDARIQKIEDILM